MLSENIKAMRKNKGMTQEELAIKLNVVRQTVSKWEKGLSVPDADMLQKLAEVLETDISYLLGQVPQKENINEIAQQLAKISEQMAIENRRRKRLWKIIGFFVAAILIIEILLAVFSFTSYMKETTYGETVNIRASAVVVEEQ